MKYSKDSQLSKQTRTHRTCKKCERKRLIKFFEKPTSLICEECKRRSRRVKKQSSIGKLKKKIEDIIKIKAKERDNYTCQKCGKQVHGLNAHASHVIPVSASQYLRLDIKNLKCLCYSCHFNWWHKHPIDASDWFKQKFPKRYQYLQQRKHIADTRTTADFEELLQSLE